MEYKVKIKEGFNEVETLPMSKSEARRLQRDLERVFERRVRITIEDARRERDGEK